MDTKERVLRLYSSGLSQSDIARILGVSRQAVHFHLRHLRNRRNPSIAQRLVLWMFFVGHIPIPHIHRTTGIAMSSIYRILFNSKLNETDGLELEKMVRMKEVAEYLRSRFPFASKEVFDAINKEHSA